MIFVIDTEVGTAVGGEMAAIDAFNDELKANDQLVFAAGIAGPARAKLIDNRLDSGSVEARSLFAQSEFYSGFWIIEAADEETALRLAQEGSKACNRRVELRPFLG